MNLVIVFGKIVSNVEFKFIYNRYSSRELKDKTSIAICRIELLNKSIGTDLELKIKRREEMLEKHKKALKITDKELECTYAVSTVIVAGDVIGLVMIISTEDNVEDVDLKLTQIASKFLSNHLEEV